MTYYTVTQSADSLDPNPRVYTVSEEYEAIDLAGELIQSATSYRVQHSPYSISDKERLEIEEQESLLVTIQEHRGEVLEEINLPSYALSALVNGDLSGLSKDDEKNIDSWELDNGYNLDHIHLVKADSHGESNFSGFPCFGLPCECCDYLVIDIRKT